MAAAARKSTAPDWHRRIGAAAVAALAWIGTAAAADKVVLQLHGPEQFEFAGYYAALWQAFYQDAGIEVDIRPGDQPRGDAVRELTEGRAQFGTGTAQLIVRAAQGQPLLLLAPIFQQSGAALYYRADGDFSSPSALTKGKIGRTPATEILDIELATALKAEGIDPNKIKGTAIETGKAVAALADHTVDAAMGSAWDLPWQARQRNVSLKSFSPGNYRVEFYGDTLFTLRRIEHTQPDLVHRFREASLKGWDYSFQHADEVIARMVAETKASPPATDPAGFFRYQAEVARALANYPNVPLGHSNPDRWARIEASMASVGALVPTADPGDFVYNPEAAARSRADERAALLLGAALIAALVIGVILVRRGRRLAPTAWFTVPAVLRPSAGPTATKPPPVAAEAELAATAPSRPSVIDLNQLLSRSERGLRERLPQQIGLRLSPGKELWRCRTDLAEVYRLTFELVAAAADDIKGAGAIIIGTRNITFDEDNVGDYPGARIGEYVRLTVRDDGPGMPGEILDRIFEPGTSARPAVAIADPIMRSLGGYARVESAEGVGTAVHLYFARETALARFKFARAAE